MMPPLSQLIAELRELAALEPGWYANVGARTGERCCVAMERAAEALARQEELIAEAGRVVEPFAEVDDEGVEDYGDDHKAVLTIGRSTDHWLTLGHFRAAARLSEKLKGE